MRPSTSGQFNNNLKNLSVNQKLGKHEEINSNYNTNAIIGGFSPSGTLVSNNNRISTARAGTRVDLKVGNNNVNAIDLSQI